jgi:hypothetical protein
MKKYFGFSHVVLVSDSVGTPSVRFLELGFSVFAKLKNRYPGQVQSKDDNHKKHRNKAYVKPRRLTLIHVYAINAQI